MGPLVYGSHDSQGVDGNPKQRQQLRERFDGHLGIQDENAHRRAHRRSILKVGKSPSVQWENDLRHFNEEVCVNIRLHDTDSVARRQRESVQDGRPAPQLQKSYFTGISSISKLSSSYPGSSLCFRVSCSSSLAGSRISLICM